MSPKKPLRLTDETFMLESLQKESSVRNPLGDGTGVEGSDLAGLRGALPGRVGGFSATDAYEPVSFMHPDSNQLVHGWLVQAMADGTAKVEIGDGEFALVPPEEIRRYGSKQDAEQVRAQLSEIISPKRQFRADLQETGDPVPLGGRAHLLTLQYSTVLGNPSDDDLLGYVAKFYPTVELLDADFSMPGRVALALAEKSAEMSAEDAGDDVIETLDPEDVKKEASTRVAAPPMSNPPGSGPPAGPAVSGQAGAYLGYRAPKDLSPKDAAKAVMGKTDVVNRALKIYFAEDGGKYLASVTGPYNTERLLAAAMPVVKRRDPGFWKQIAQMVPAPTPETMNPQATPPIAGQPAPTGQAAPTDPSNPMAPKPMPAMPPAVQQAFEQLKNAPGMEKVPDHLLVDMANQKVRAPGSLPSPAIPNQDPSNPVQGTNPVHVGPKTSNKRASVFVSKKPVVTHSRAAAFEAQYDKKPTYPEANDSKHFTDNGLPASAWHANLKMKMNRMGRRGDYVMARVEFDPKDFPDDANCKWAVQSFVTRQLNKGEAYASFGVTGPVHILSLDTKKGTAQVRFATLQAGAVPLETTESDAD